MNRAFSRIFGIILTATAVVASAQDVGSNSLSDQNVATARAMIRDSQEAMIRDALRLTPEEDAEFWPLYEKYRADLLPIQNRYVALVSDYMSTYQSGGLTDEDASDMLDSYFDIKGDLLRERKGYIRKFRKILPMLKVARFYQLETKLIVNVDAELALIVPLAE